MRCSHRGTFSQLGSGFLGVDPGPGLVPCTMMPHSQVPWHLGYQSVLAYRYGAGAFPPMPPPRHFTACLRNKGALPHISLVALLQFHSSVGCCAQAE